MTAIHPIQAIKDMDINQDDFEATYSPEDNKLRFRVGYRLDSDLYGIIKDAGFNWAPKQELFVAPKWTPLREDICLALAGDIEAEHTTLAERAEAKAERLAGYAINRANDSNAYFKRSQHLSARFENGQPILIGHHSERSARRDAARAENAKNKSIENHKKAQYWLYKSANVIHHANGKNCDRTRLNRIEKIAKDLRDMQKTINTFYMHRERLIEKQNLPEEAKEKWVRLYDGAYPDQVKIIYTGSEKRARDLLDDGEMTVTEIIDKSIKVMEQALNNEYRQRWINHYLNRLGYEREELGVITRYSGELKTSIIQTFMRYHGAAKPKAKKSERGFNLVCEAPLPVHIADGLELDLTNEEWLDLMADYGYEVPNKLRDDTPKAPPLLNLKIDRLVIKAYGNTTKDLKVMEMTKAEYKKLYHEHRQVGKSACGNFRMKTAFIRSGEFGFQGTRYGVLITDSKQHETPEEYKAFLKQYDEEMTVGAIAHEA